MNRRTKRTKKLGAAVLTLVMLLGLFPAITPRVQAANPVYLGDGLKAYQIENCIECADGETFRMGGVEYYRGIFTTSFGRPDGEAYYNIGGQYNSLSGLYGLIDGGPGWPETITIYGDGRVLAEFSMKGGSLPKLFSIGVAGVQQLKISLPNWGKTALANLLLSEDPPQTFTLTTAATVGGTASAGGVYNLGTNILLSAMPNSGYALDGWYENGVKVSGEAQYNFDITEDRTLEARFVLVTYTVTFADGSRTIAQTIVQGRAATAPNWSKPGYTLSWDQTFNNITKNITVNAKWTPITYTVTFKDRKTALSTQNVEYGKAAAAPWNPSRTGYTFKGWDKSFNKITGNLTVNAKWKVNTVTLTFNANGGKVGKKSSVKVKRKYGQKVKLPKKPTRKGYKFKGWYTTSYASYWGDTKVTGKTKVPVSSATYYARWA